MFYVTVNMIHDIRTASPFSYAAKFMLVGVRNNKTQQIKHRKINRIHSVVVY